MTGIIELVCNEYLHLNALYNIIDDMAVPVYIHVSYEESE